MERGISYEFHFKQSVNRKMKDSMFINSENREKFRPWVNGWNGC